MGEGDRLATYWMLTIEKRGFKTSAHYSQLILQIKTANNIKLKKVTKIFWFSYCKILVIYCC